LIEALSHVVDLLSRHASIIVLNKRIISSGYDTTLPINSDFKKLINLESEITEEKKTYEKKYTIINSVVSAINNSANVQASTKGATIYTTSLLTPKDVYFAIQAEIKEIIYLEIDYNETTSEDFSYDKESKEVIGMLLESGINYKKILINNKTNKNNFLKSIIDFGYYYKSEEKSQKIQRNELLSFTGFLSKVQFGVKKDIKGKVLINSET
jgi:deoxycytidylate deaminase